MRDDLLGARHAAVVEAVEGVPAAAPAAHLDDPRPDVLRRGVDGDRPRGDVGPSGHDAVARKATGGLLVGRAPARRPGPNDQHVERSEPEGAAQRHDGAHPHARDYSSTLPMLKRLPRPTRAARSDEGRSPTDLRAAAVPPCSTTAGRLPVYPPWNHGEESTMSDGRPAPESRGVTAELLTTVDLGPEIEGMEGRRLRMRKVTIEPGGVFGPVHDHKGRPGTVYILQGTITDHRGRSRHRLRAGMWAGPRTGTPRTGSRTGGRSRRWRSRSTSSRTGKLRARPRVRTDEGGGRCRTDMPSPCSSSRGAPRGRSHPTVRAGLVPWRSASGSASPSTSSPSSPQRGWP